MYCATNWNRGCPIVDKEPVHLFLEGKRTCARCNAYKPKDLGEAL